MMATTIINSINVKPSFRLVSFLIYSSFAWVSSIVKAELFRTSLFHLPVTQGAGIVLDVFLVEVQRNAHAKSIFLLIRKGRGILNSRVSTSLFLSAINAQPNQGFPLGVQLEGKCDEMRRWQRQSAAGRPEFVFLDKIRHSKPS
jgi:hypothetical protein